MIDRVSLAVIAILSIAATTTADAKPRHARHAALQKTVICTDRGCSDQVNSIQAARQPRSAAKAKRERVSRAAVRTQGVVTCTMHGCSDQPQAAARSVPATAPAETPRRQRQARATTRTGHGEVICDNHGCRARSGDRTAAVATAPALDANGNVEATVVGGRPEGCPRAFCGCEASRYVFGEIRPYLNLASNWIRKFPRTEAGPGMVAARSGHVMVLMSHVGGNDWLVHDGNSGGGRTREHVRSIRGYVIVDPRGSRTAERETIRQ